MVLVWWYTRGLLNVLKRVRDHAVDFAKFLNLPTMVRYLFVPMYGYNDIWSRLISLGVRFVQLVITTIVAALYMVWQCILVAVWVAVPILIVGNIGYQLVELLWTL